MSELLSKYRQSQTQAIGDTSRERGPNSQSVHEIVQSIPKYDHPGDVFDRLHFVFAVKLHLWVVWMDDVVQFQLECMGMMMIDD